MKLIIALLLTCLSANAAGTVSNLNSYVLWMRSNVLVGQWMTADQLPDGVPTNSTVYGSNVSGSIPASGIPLSYSGAGATNIASTYSTNQPVTNVVYTISQASISALVVLGVNVVTNTFVIQTNKSVTTRTP